MSRHIEILAPAGSYDGMRAAMNAGCDAVYIGGSSFGARAYADNLTEDDLLRAIDEAHIRDKKLYLTVNTLLKDKELTEELYKFIERFYLQGLDAVIVQDVGVMHFIHSHFPGLAIHASTQMTLMMAQGADLLTENGVTRLVTARELSLEEIKAIRAGTKLEIETFVHGALCYCYSGQCLMSSIIGGRSGNRGRCAQPCRMPYQLYSQNRRISAGQEKYLLSPKDINTLAIIPEFVEAGIDSFKIEGRMKRPEYAAAVSYIYRKYVDLYQEQGRGGYVKLLEGDEFREDLLILQDVYNRGGFSQGYAGTYHGKNMMSLYRPNHSGVLVGEVKEIKGSQVGITLIEKVNAQDILEIRHGHEEGYEFTVKTSHSTGDILRTNIGRRPEDTLQAVKTSDGNPQKNINLDIHIKDPVYRTKNNELMDYLNSEYLKKDRKLGINGSLKAKTGERLSFTVAFGDCKATAYQDIVMEAEKQPMTREKLLSQLEKTGDTLYYFEDIKLETDGNIFIPVAWLNDIRREAIRLLQEKILQKYRRNLPPDSDVIKASGERIPFDTGVNHDIPDTELDYNIPVKNNKFAFGITVSVQTTEQLKTVLTLPEISAVYAEYDAISDRDIIGIAKETAAAGKAFYLSLPHICRLSAYQRLKKDLPGLMGAGEVKGFLVKNFEEIYLLQSFMSSGQYLKEIILNYNMYICNKEAKAFWKEKDVFHFTAPVELNYKELKELGLTDCDMLVYGYLPLMVSAQCLFENTKGCIKKETAGGRDLGKAFDTYLTDRLGKKFFIKNNCTGCYNVIYNGQVLALHKQTGEIAGLHPQNIRLDFFAETPEQLKQIVTVFVERFAYGRTDTQEIPDYTTGHFKRGIV